MRPRDHAAMAACADAEARGDLDEAIHHYESIPQFDEALHGYRLRQLAALGSQAPGWMWSRWMTLQVRRPLWSDAPRGTDPDPDLARTAEIAYPNGVPTERMDGMSMPVFLATLLERDWVHRQLVVYESGRLDRFVRERAGGLLLARADHPLEWASAPMGGYRLDGDDNGVLQVTDLATGVQREILDLGLAFQHWPGRHFLGRLVPTVSGPGAMFEWRPLPVDAETAALVAASPGTWTSIVAARARSGDLPDMFSLMDDDTELVADLPDRPWLGFLEPEDIDELPQADGIIDYDDVAMVVLDRLLHAAARAGHALHPARAAIWSLALNPDLEPLIRAAFRGAEHRAGWLAFAELVPEPARQRCLRYADAAAPGLRAV